MEGNITSSNATEFMVLCPGQPDYCDCALDCIDLQEYCGCQEAVDCCAAFQEEGWMEEEEMTTEQESSLYWNLLIIAKVVSLLSAMGSAYIIYSMIFDVKDADHRRKKLHRTFDRMLLCLCVVDFIASMSIFLGSWSVPADPPMEWEDQAGFVWDNYDLIFPQAVGTMGTCIAQGWFNLTAYFASWLFTGCISVSFLLQIKFELREKQMRVAEKCFIAVSTLPPLAFSTVALAKQEIGPSRFLGYCTAGIKYGAATNYGINFVLAVGIVSATTVAVCLGILFWSIRTQELRTAQWSTAARAGRNQKRVFIKSMLYIAAFLVVWVPPMGLRVRGLVKVSVLQYYPYFAAFFFPLQGVLNALIHYDPLRTELQKKIRTSIGSIRSLKSRKSSKTQKAPEKAPDKANDVEEIEEEVEEHDEKNNDLKDPSECFRVQ